MSPPLLLLFLDVRHFCLSVAVLVSPALPCRLAFWHMASSIQKRDFSVLSTTPTFESNWEDCLYPLGL